jgi:hypothetical protein
MLTVSDRLTFRKTKNKNSSVVLHTLEHNRTDQIKCILSQLSQPGVVSQLVEAYARHLLAHVQLDETRYVIGLSGGGTARHSKLSR